MIVATVHHFLTFWNIPSWAVAVGTVFLGAATVRLGGKAQNEADAVAKQAKLSGEQLDLTRQQLEASQRPFVLPVTDDSEDLASTWHVNLNNAGAGPAYNVQGALFWPGGIGGGWQLIPVSIPAGGDRLARLEVHVGHSVKWAEALGYLRYFDLAGTEWQTHFRFQQNAASQYSVAVTKLGKTIDLGEPHYTV